MGSHPGDGALVDLLPNVYALRDGLDAVDYLADEGTVTALFCAARLRQPVRTFPFPVGHVLRALLGTWLI